MDSFPAALVAGFGVGVAVAAPVGPMGILCVQRTLCAGIGAGIATGFAAALTQVFWGAVIVAGHAASAFAWSEAESRALHALSAAMLAWFAMRILRRRVGLSIRSAGLASPLSRCFLSAMALGLGNPLTLVLLAAAVPAFALSDRALDLPRFLAGQFCGAFGWWLLVGGTMGALRARVGAAVLGWINVASGLLLAALAARTGARAFGL